MHQMSQKEVSVERLRLWKEQKEICPLCLEKIVWCDAALDHCHTTGRIRGVLHKNCNSAEGALKSKFIRSGAGKLTSFEEYLLQLHLYLIKEHHLLLHPSHAPRPRKLMKRSYNKLKREIEKCNKFIKRPLKVPPYPKSKRLTKKLKELYESFGIEAEYYG